MGEVTSVKIIPYEEKYQKDVEKLCIETGSKDNLVNQQHYNFTLLMYCDPYLKHGKCFLLLDDEDKVQGYILCAENIFDFVKKMEPYFAEIKEKSPTFAYRCDMSEYLEYGEQYPAHLHIDIRESYTGHGRGSALMNTLFTALEEDGVKGILVDVSADNPRAFHFYQKMGFQVLESNEDGSVLGKEMR